MKFPPQPRQRTAVLLLLCLSALYLAACASAPVATMATAPRVAVDYAPAVEQARRVLEKVREEGKIPGLGVAVGLGDRVVWSEGLGFADPDAGVRVTPATRFRLASVSKILTVALLGKLWQQGKLDLDAPVSRYVPSWPDKGYPITVRQLAGHLGGIRHYAPQDFMGRIDEKSFASVTEGLSVFADDPLVAPPGTAYQYSTFGYTLIAAAIEGATGEEFLPLMEREVFRPLGMAATAPNLPLPPNLSRFFVVDADGNPVPAPPHTPSYKWAGGGFVSTAEDVGRFGQAHLKAGFLEQRTLDLLFTPQKTADGKETGVGIGWRIGRDAHGRRFLAHGGNQAGARSILVVYPEEGWTIAILTNLGGVPAAIEEVAAAVMAPFLRLGAQAPR